MQKEKLSQIVSAMYRWCNRWPRNAFNNDQAYAAHQAYVDKLQKDFDAFLQSHQELNFFTREERRKARKEGVAINGYTEADHGDTGPENA